MPGNRSRHEIIYAMLMTIHETEGGIKPTPLQRKSGLSTTSFSQYCVDLLGKGLIEEKFHKKRKYLMLTEKGFRYIKEYKAFLDIIDDFGLS